MRLVVMLMLLLVVSSSCSNSDEPMRPGGVEGGGAAIWRPIPPDKTYEGKSLEEWGIAWKLWGFAQTSCDSPGFDKDGSLCGLYQDPESPVFFLDFSAYQAPRTHCRIPEGKAIVVPMMTFYDDNAGNPKIRSEEELLASVDEAYASMGGLELRVDGVTIRNLDEYGFGPVRYSYRIPPAPNWYSCNGHAEVADTTVEPSFLAGFVAVLPPPPKSGKHRLEYGGVVTFQGKEYPLAADTTFVVEGAKHGDD